MGSPLSPIIADIAIQELELNALISLNVIIPNCYRYVDDIFLTIPNDKVAHVLDVFNSIDNRLQFTT